jgi:hypothetical protein
MNAPTLPQIMRGWDDTPPKVEPPALIKKRERQERDRIKREATKQRHAEEDERDRKSFAPIDWDAEFPGTE